MASSSPYSSADPPSSRAQEVLDQLEELGRNPSPDLAKKIEELGGLKNLLGQLQASTNFDYSATGRMAMGMRSPPASIAPDTSSPVYPDRPIRPMPKRRLRDRLSAEEAEAFQLPTFQTTTSLFSFPYVQPEKTAAPTARERSEAEHEHTCDTCRHSHDHDHSEVESEGEDDGKLRDGQYDGTKMSKPPAPESNASSADGYESFENTNNKKKRKIPQSNGLGVGGHHSTLAADLASMALGSRESDITSPRDENSPHVGSYYGSGSAVMPTSGSGTGISGPGRGRYGRSGRGSLDRRPLGASTNGLNAAASGRNRLSSHSWATKGYATLLLLPLPLFPPAIPNIITTLNSPSLSSAMAAPSSGRPPTHPIIRPESAPPIHVTYSTSDSMWDDADQRRKAFAVMFATMERLRAVISSTLYDSQLKLLRRFEGVRDYLDAFTMKNLYALVLDLRKQFQDEQGDYRTTKDIDQAMQSRYTDLTAELALVEKKFWLDKHALRHKTPGWMPKMVNWTPEMITNYHTGGSQPQPNEGIIGATLANAPQGPPGGPKGGQENVSVLSQQAGKPGQSSAFTFTYENEASNKVVWPGQHTHLPRAPTAPVNPADARRGNTHGQAAPPQGQQQQAPGALGAAQQQPQQKKKPRRPGAVFRMAARQRRLQQEYNNFHHPPRRDEIWICEFCEYESIFGEPPHALIRQYEIKDREEQKRLAEKRRLLEKAKMKGRKNRKGGSKKKGKTNAQAGGAAEVGQEQGLGGEVYDDYPEEDGYYEDEYGDEEGFDGASPAPQTQPVHGQRGVGAGGGGGFTDQGHQPQRSVPTGAMGPPPAPATRTR